jgi:SAM-dependent methyltransferase
LNDYYSLRAGEYEEIYGSDDPVRQQELASIADAIREAFLNLRVLEPACGTGYWTAVLTQVAKQVVAVDASPEMLEVARGKGLPKGKVEFLKGDAYYLESVPGKFDGGLANFWLSHVPKARVQEFLHGFHNKLRSKARVFMADNVYLPGVGGELLTHPGREDTFKLRELSDGTKHEVLKNYYDEAQLRALLSPVSHDLSIHTGKCYWWVKYRVKS